MPVYSPCRISCYAGLSFNSSSPDGSEVRVVPVWTGKTAFMNINQGNPVRIGILNCLSNAVTIRAMYTINSGKFLKDYISVLRFGGNNRLRRKTARNKYKQ